MSGRQGFSVMGADFQLEKAVMKKAIASFAILVIFFCAGAASAADLKIQPADVTLTGPHASQRLLVFTEETGQVIGDRTPQAKFTSSHPAVATVDAAGTVRAAGDGETTITATVEGKRATVKVTARKVKEPFAWSFRNHVIPMLTRAGCNSGACHGALAGKGGLKLSLRGYDPASDHFVLTRQALGRRVDRSEPARSLVLLKPTQAVSHGGGQKIEVGSPDYRVLADWIAAGAPGPRADDTRIQRLEVLPAAAVLKPKDTLQIVVRAWYSDGHSEDVTRWAKFNSSEDLVATVNADGKATVAGHGEAADHRVVLQPRRRQPHRLAAARTPSIRRCSHPPRDIISSMHWFSRSCKTCASRPRRHVPTPSSSAGRTSTRPASCRSRKRCEKFLADKAPDKRAKLIDALLERPEFVDYWAYKWSDLLLITTRRLPQPAVWSFYQFVRQSVADNKPWDRFARDILTASGGNLENGAANYFVLHKDVTDLTESTAVTFLGMSITCCRCHNHPLEKWTQDQYWAHGQPVLARGPQERRPRRRGQRAVACRPATCRTCAAACRCRRRRSMASRCHWTARSTAGSTSPTG